jgi:hypothetical protein
MQTRQDTHAISQRKVLEQYVDTVLVHESKYSSDYFLRCVSMASMVIVNAESNSISIGNMRYSVRSHAISVVVIAKTDTLLTGSIRLRSERCS